MMCRRTHWLASIACLVIGSTPLSSRAQAVTIQQPVVRSFQATGTVVVPDRGSALIGRVGSANSFRQSAGPFRTGSTLGGERSHTSVSSSVYIHDLRAMDEALLATAPATSRDRADFFEAQLMVRQRGPFTQLPAAEMVHGSTPATSLNEAERFEKLARVAAAKGKDSVARLHWRMAAKHGSKTAAEHLKAATVGQ